MLETLPTPSPPAPPARASAPSSSSSPSAASCPDTTASRPEPPDRLRGLAPAGADTAGRRLLAGLLAGTATPPPAARTLTLPPATLRRPGLILCDTVFEEELTLTPGVVFGGWIACLTDHFAGLVMLSALPDGSGFLTANLSVAYHAPLVPGPVAVETELTSCTTRRAVAEVRFTQAGALASVGTVEQIVFRRSGRADARQ
ncbi:hypothetical protein ACZ90_14215 [Streptomyces albus subsp. albus]|nr:hypothetical protein ACZ90_14215 [Streptomyces albus subsp. albus]